MSTKLHLSFATDMPPASIEVVTPDFRTVAQVWLGPGASTTVEVPALDVMVQVRMPSGKTVTLSDPGNTDRLIDRTALAGGYEPLSTIPPRPAGRIREAEAVGRLGETFTRSLRSLPPPPPTPSSRLRLTAATPPSTGELAVVLTEGRIPRSSTASADQRSLFFTPDSSRADAFDLTVTGSPDEPDSLHVRLPGSLAALTVSLTTPGDGDTLKIRAETRRAEADTLGAYLARGDLRAAASMTSWVERAEEMLYDKGADPNAATVGAYLLLRLRRFDLMRIWARNLADRWPDLADGSVIWAWQLILQRGDTREIGEYLIRAATCPHLPIFTEGLKLLQDGLRLLGEEASDHLRRLNERVGVVLWTSPFTACLPQGSPPGGPDLRIEAAYTTERLPVESSALDTVGYDTDDQTLEVKFDDGTIYRYFDVPEETYRDLLEADSKGGYFNANVKAAGFRYHRLK